jgi:hypothetical protein
MSKERGFQNLRRPKRAPDRDVATVEACIAKLMMLPEGQIFFDWMRGQTTFAIVGPDASDGALRGAEAKRQLMLVIEGMGQRGGRSKRNTSTDRSGV